MLDGQHQWAASLPAISWRTRWFPRTENRHDYAVPPPREIFSSPGRRRIGRRLHRQNCLDLRFERRDGGPHSQNNEQSIDQTIAALNDDSRGMIFSNLVDFDMLFGHRRDTEGFARRLSTLIRVCLKLSAQWVMTI